MTNPSAPRPVRTVAAGNPVIGNLAGTHKSWWECDTGIAYIVGSRASDAASGWRRGNHIMIFDLGNPASPVFKRDWALDGQQPGGAIPPNFAAVPSIHGPISTGPAGNRVYFAYGTSSNGVMQIVDRSKLLSSDPTDFKTAEVGRWVMNPDNGAHTTFPIGKMAVADFAPNAQGKTREFVYRGQSCRDAAARAMPDGWTLGADPWVRYEKAGSSRSEFVVPCELLPELR